MKKSIAYAVSKGLVLAALSQAALADGVEYEIQWDEATNYYRVYMRPDATPTIDRTLSAQVTLRFPHGTIPAATNITDIEVISAHEPGATWAASSRAIAPTEDPTVDYISFTPTISNQAVFDLTAGEQQEIFRFTTGSACLGPVEIMDNENDPFNNPTPPATTNSMQSNPGNEFSSLMWPAANDFLGIEGSPAVCKAVSENSAPVANADSASVEQDSSVSINVLGNDTDADGDSLTIDNFDAASAQGGTVTSSNNQLTYTPPVGFVGTDTFTYTVTDGEGVSSAATVTITVTDKQGTNTSPVANADSASVEQDSSVSINVLGNDTDADGDSLTIDNFDAASAQGGTVTSSNNQLTYTPPVGFVGTDTFTYTVTDGEGVSSAATVTITVTDKQGTNTSPVANADSASVEQDGAVNIDVLGNDTDADGDNLTIDNFDAASAQGGTVTSSNNQLTYTPPVGFVGTDTFTYTVTDGEGVSSAATVTITVTDKQGTNTSPVANADSASVEQDGAVNIDVLGNDTDADGDNLTISAKTDGANGTVVIVNDASVTYTPNAGYTGSDSFTYTITDGEGGTSTATVTMAVTDKQGTNASPVANADSANVEQDGSVGINVLGNDTDADGDNLTISAKTDGANGTVVIVNDTSVTYTPNAGYTGSDSFTYTITDGEGGTSTAMVTISVAEKNGTNSAPVVVNESVSVPVMAGESVDVDVLSNVFDADSDTLTITAVGTAANGTVTIENGQVRYVANAGFSGEDTFTYTVSDGNNEEVTGSVTVTVRLATASDSDGDGLSNDDEAALNTDPNVADSDGDGISDLDEVGDDVTSPIDTDNDGTIDALDTDDDNDGLLTRFENYNGGSPADNDTDRDGTPDYLDPDDDNDGMLTAQESADPNGDGDPADALDTNRDGRADYLQRPGGFAPDARNPIPTLTQWAQILLSMLLGLVALGGFWRKKF